MSTSQAACEYVFKVWDRDEQKYVAPNWNSGKYIFTRKCDAVKSITRGGRGPVPTKYDIHRFKMVRSEIE